MTESKQEKKKATFDWKTLKTVTHKDGLRVTVKQLEGYPPRVDVHRITKTDKGESPAKWKRLLPEEWRWLVAQGPVLETTLKQSEEAVAKVAALKTKTSKEKAVPKKKAEAKKDKGEAKAKKGKAVEKHTHPSGKIIRRNPEKGETVLQAAA